MNWHVHQADHEGVVFRGPDGSWYPAICNYGKFDHECEEAFDRVRAIPMRAGLVRERFRLAQRTWPNGETTTFSVEFPERLFRGGPSRSEKELLGFRLITPERHRVELLFERRRPPVEFAELITALFGEPDTQEKEKRDGQGKLRQVAVPVDGGARQGSRDGRAGEGVEADLGLRQAVGQRDVQRREARQEVSEATSSSRKPTKEELIQKFLSERSGRPDSSSPKSSTDAKRAGRLAP